MPQWIATWKSHGFRDYFLGSLSCDHLKADYVSPLLKILCLQTSVNSLIWHGKVYTLWLQSIFLSSTSSVTTDCPPDNFINLLPQIPHTYFFACGSLSLSRINLSPSAYPSVLPWIRPPLASLLTFSPTAPCPPWYKNLSPNIETVLFPYLTFLLNCELLYTRTGSRVVFSRL